MIRLITSFDKPACNFLRQLARLPYGTTHNVASLFPVMNSFGGLQVVDETGLDGIYTWVRDLRPPTKKPRKAPSKP